MILFSVRVSAQTTEVSSVSSGIWLDVGAGGYTCDYEKFLIWDYSGGVGVNVGVRYTKMFNNYLGWDVLKINAQTDLKKFSDMLDVQIMSGLRLVSPVLFGHQTAYFSAAIGGTYFTGQNKGNFAWEGGLGINVSPKFSIGAFYNSQSVYESNVGFVGLRVGLKL